MRAAYDVCDALQGELLPDWGRGLGCDWAALGLRPPLSAPYFCHLLCTLQRQRR